jgi:hypothetical protein
VVFAFMFPRATCCCALRPRGAKSQLQAPPKRSRALLRPCPCGVFSFQVSLSNVLKTIVRSCSRPSSAHSSFILDPRLPFHLRQLLRPS